MGFIRDFIKRKEDEITRESYQAVNQLDKEWNFIVKKDTYLIYENKTHLLNLVKKGNTQTKIPWYLFWDFWLKSKLQSNLKKLSEFEEEITGYNANFVSKKKVQYKDLFKRDNLVLDDDQQTAIITDDKHNLVVAGAGSGKTTTMAMRVVWLLANSSNPEDIVAFTFTEKAAQNMKNRVYEKVGKIEPGLCNKLGEAYIGTIHAYCYRMLQDHFGFGNYEVLDENQEMAFIMRHGWNLGLGHNGSYVKNCGNFLKSINVVYDEMITNEELRNTIKKLVTYKKAYPKSIRNSFRGLRHSLEWPLYKNNRCYAGKIFCMIMPDGTVLPCDRITYTGKLYNAKEIGVKTAFDKMPTVRCNGCSFCGSLEMNYLAQLKFDVLDEIMAVVK